MVCRPHPGGGQLPASAVGPSRDGCTPAGGGCLAAPSREAAAPPPQRVSPAWAAGRRALGSCALASHPAAPAAAHPAPTGAGYLTGVAAMAVRCAAPWRKPQVAATAEPRPPPCTATHLGFSLPVNGPAWVRGCIPVLHCLQSQQTYHMLGRALHLAAAGHSLSRVHASAP